MEKNTIYDTEIEQISADGSSAYYKAVDERDAFLADAPRQMQRVMALRATTEKA